MKAAVRRYAAGAEFHTEEGCFINELSNIADDPSVSIARARVAPGVTTADLDAKAEQLVLAAGAAPAFKGYRGYPATLCASVNDEVVHGIPANRALVSGDIISLDMGVKLDGYYGDSAVTVAVGEISSDAQRLLTVTREALHKGIAQARPGGRVSDIGHAIQEHVEAAGFSVVREYVGHGIGSQLHEELQIANYGEPGRGPRLVEGMVRLTPGVVGIRNELTFPVTAAIPTPGSPATTFRTPPSASSLPSSVFPRP